MKRSEALSSLSRDHHVALVVARELVRAGSEQAQAAAERFVRFLAEHELGHFALEESVLLPLVPREEPGPALARRVREDHEYLRAAMRRLKASPDAASVEFLKEVGDRLRAHVRMEERELFPYLEASLDAGALEAVAARLAHEPADQPTEVAGRFLEAFTSRDVDTLLSLADPEIELHPLRLTGTPAYRGHDGIRHWLRERSERAGEASFEVEEIRASDHEHAIARVRLRLGGEELAAVTAVFTVRAGRVAEVHDEDLLSSVGAI